MMSKKIELGVMCITLLSIVGCSGISDNHSDSAQVNVKQTVDGNKSNVESSTNGNTTTNQAENSSTTSTQEQSTTDRNAKITSLCNRLALEFQQYLTDLSNTDNTKYDYIMAMDRLNGLGVYNVPVQTDISSLLKAHVQQADVELQDSIVYSGYSQSGMHFVALVPTYLKSQNVFQQATNQIRGEQDEFQMLNEISEQTSYRTPIENSYYPIDIYAEDMLDSPERLEVENITISDNLVPSTNATGVLNGKHPTTTGNQLLQDLVKKYNRKLGDVHSISNKSWNLFAFQGATGVHGKHQLVVELANERVVLVNQWWER